jgi:diaminopimelate decarboxylase
MDQIRLLGTVPGRTVCSIRVNPGEGHGGTNKTNTGGPSSKHGIYFDQVSEAKSVAHAAGLRIVGVHAHIGSDGHEIEPWLRIKNLTLEIASTFPDLQFVNLGGGLPVVYDDMADKPLLVSEWGSALSNSMVEFSQKMGRQITLQIEPGRYVVAHCGTLLADVQAVKSTPAYEFAIVNTGLNHNIRPSMYGSYHPIRFARRVARPLGKMHAYVVAGYLCESGDVFTIKNDGSGILEPRIFEELCVGDLMVMGCIGAYSHAMKSEYNSMNLPASVLIATDGSERVIERRGNLEDVMRRELEAYDKER